MSNPVFQFQIISKEPDATGQFYSELFGWTITPDNVTGHRIIDTGSREGIQGGIWPAPPQLRTSYSCLWPWMMCQPQCGWRKPKGRKCWSARRGCPKAMRWPLCTILKAWRSRSADAGEPECAETAALWIAVDLGDEG
jgi:hypothetical protein